VAKLKDAWAKRNTKVLALSVDTTEHHEGWSKDIDECFPGGAPDFPIIADHDRKISVLYGMLDQSEIDGKGLPLTVRSVYVIDPKKLIRAKIDYPASSGRNFNEIIRLLDSLQLVSQYKVATPSDWTPGGEVVVVPTLTDEEANGLFPKGFRKLKPYLRLTADPQTTSA
jgi:alkyl hydroperoxide reductase subunit AhpC